MTIDNNKLRKKLADQMEKHLHGNLDKRNDDLYQKEFGTYKIPVGGINLVHT